MSLLTDTIFVKALRNNVGLIGRLPAGDVYNTSIALPDEDIDNAPLPYIIVSYDNMANDQSTKDGFEGDTDSVNISIEVAAKTRPELAEIAEAVRSTVRMFFTMAREYPDVEIDGMTEDDYDLVPLDYQLTAQGVQYDSMKPCYWQVLNYQCDTNV